MKGSGKKNGILFLGEFPGESEDVAGVPFVGKAGEILKALVSDFHLSEFSYFTNSCRCRPRNNRTPRIDEIRTCRKHLNNEIQRVNPKAIISLGTIPAKCMTNSDRARIGNLRGTFSDYKGIPVFYINHPSAILYDRRIKVHLEEDFKKFSHWWKSGRPNIRKDKPMYSIHDWQSIKTQFATLDIETTGLDPYLGDAIKCISVATSPTDVYYHLLKQDEDILDVLDCLREVRILCCHNTVFDMSFLTKDIPANHWLWTETTWEDTMIALQFKDEMYPNTSLDHLSQVYCNVRKLPMPDFVKNSFPIGWDTPQNKRILQKYNCNDSIATFELAHNLRPLEDSKEYRAYRWVSHNLKLAVRMRHSGIHLSQKRIENLYILMTEKIREHEKILCKGVDIHSIKSISKHLFQNLKLPVLKRTAKRNEPALDSEVLERLAPIDSTGWVAAYKEWKQFGVTRDRYCTNLMRWGRIAHPRIFISRYAEGGEGFGANTGRITCEGFINLPREGGVKNCLTSRYKKGVILSLDYSQMEMRILANESKDENMISAFVKGVDLHSFTSAQILGKNIRDVTPEERQRGKTVNFSVVYGSTIYGLAKKQNISNFQAQKFLDSYSHRFPGVAEYVRKQHELAKRYKKVYSPLGRPFHLYNAGRDEHELRKSVNSPIQIGSNDFCTEAAHQLQNFIAENKLNASVILMVYDSIVSDWSLDSWEFLGEFKNRNKLIESLCVHKVIQNFSDLNWNITVPIEFEVKFGPSLGEVK
jgi:uracil-DNA glycosylase family 4